MGILGIGVFMPCTVDQDLATRIAEEYVGQLKTNGEFQLVILSGATIWARVWMGIFLGTERPFDFERYLLRRAIHSFDSQVFSEQFRTHMASLIYTETH